MAKAIPQKGGDGPHCKFETSEKEESWDGFEK